MKTKTEKNAVATDPNHDPTQSPREFFVRHTIDTILQTSNEGLSQMRDHFNNGGTVRLEMQRKNGKTVSVAWLAVSAPTVPW